jgi:hypothetical protein
MRLLVSMFILFVISLISIWPLLAEELSLEFKFAYSDDIWSFAHIFLLPKLYFVHPLKEAERKDTFLVHLTLPSSDMAIW